MLLRVVVLLGAVSLARTQRDTSESESSSGTADHYSRTHHSYYRGFPYAYAGARDGFAYPYASSGFGFPFPNLYSTMLNPWFPFWISPPAPWYEGPNVCTKESNRTEPLDPEYEKLLADEGFSTDVTENCRGNNKIYICTKSFVEDGKMITTTTTRQCCHGYKMATEGYPRCVESPGENDPGSHTEPEPGSPKKHKSQPDFYTLV